MADTAERVVYSARFPKHLYQWLRDHVGGRDLSLNDFLVGLVEDARSWFGLPRVMAMALEADAKACGLDRREYVLHVLTRRYEQLLSNKPGFDCAQQQRTKK